ncbi:methylamine utilization protein MauE [Actinocatenispora thailandica]|uniref:Methylamine utilization protein MauE n=1 Tax=Actinocatenispora thailandica TaxID=227318 RepID=A0A7R7DKK4_9ACTN|nr:MauE/DoxX family redox-associated membrane protein [Actinocatenispora thailandica]BCJ33460.1 methylamine utilization protein MauE [Actinocatenispora thailandica]
MAYLSFAARCLILAIFAASAASKLRGPAAFAEFRRSAAALGGPVPLPTAALAPIVVTAEVAVVLLLAVPATVGFGFALAIALLAAFSIAIVAAVRAGTRAPCRCFGASTTPLGAPHVVRNAALLTAAALGLVATIRPHAGLHPAGAALSLVAAAAVAVPAIRFDDFAALFTGTTPRSPSQYRKGT